MLHPDLTLPPVLRDDTLDLRGDDTEEKLRDAGPWVRAVRAHRSAVTDETLVALPASLTSLELHGCSCRFGTTLSLPPLLTSLSVHGSVCRVDFGAQFEGQLRALLLSGTRCETAGLVKFLSSQRGLRDLAMMGMDVPESLLAAVHCENLEAVSLDNARRLNEASLLKFLLDCPKLKFLSLNSSLTVSPPFIAALAALPLEQLYAPQMDNDYACLSMCSKSLDKLCVSFCKNMTGACFVAPVWRNLSVLSLVGCAKIDDAALQAVARVAPSLSIVNFSRCNVSDVGLIAVFEACAALREVALYGCVKVSSAAVVCLAESCPLVEVMVVAGCRLMDGVALQNALTLRHLRTLDISGAHLSDAVVIETFRRARLTSSHALSRIVMVDCKLLGEVGVAEIIARTPNLTYLNVEVGSEHDRPNNDPRRPPLATLKAQNPKVLLRY